VIRFRHGASLRIGASLIGWQLSSIELIDSLANRARNVNRKRESKGLAGTGEEDYNTSVGGNP